MTKVTKLKAHILFLQVKNKIVIIIYYFIYNTCKNDYGLVTNYFLLNIGDFIEQAQVSLGKPMGGSISQCLRDKSKTAYGYIWCYAD